MHKFKSPIRLKIISLVPRENAHFFYIKQWVVMTELIALKLFHMYFGSKEVSLPVDRVSEFENSIFKISSTKPEESVLSWSLRRPLYLT